MKQLQLSVRKYWSLWLLAVMPLFFHLLLTLCFPESALTTVVYLAISLCFLLIDYLQYRKQPDCSVYVLIAGILFIPFYLFLRKDETGRRIKAPLFAWIIGYVCYLSVLSVI